MHNLQILLITSFLQTRFYEQGSTDKVLRFKNALQASECYSPTSSHARVLVIQASVVAYLQVLPSIFFPTICSMQESNEITTNELRMRTTFQRVLLQEFYFGSQVAAFSRDPSH